MKLKKYIEQLEKCVISKIVNGDYKILSIDSTSSRILIDDEYITSIFIFMDGLDFKVLNNELLSVENGEFFVLSPEEKETAWENFNKKVNTEYSEISQELEYKKHKLARMEKEIKELENRK